MPESLNKNSTTDAKKALGEEVKVLDGETETGTTNSGKIYKAWMDIKAVFTGHDRYNSANKIQQQELPESSTWVTVNTSTTENVARMEVSKSEDYDLVIKTRQ